MKIYADMPQPDGSTVRYFPYWYRRDQCYKVLNRSGEDSNKDENATRVLTLEDLAQRIRERYAVRMAPVGGSRPSRISPDRITVKQEG